MRTIELFFQCESAATKWLRIAQAKWGARVLFEHGPCSDHAVRWCVEASGTPTTIDEVYDHHCVWTSGWLAGHDHVVAALNTAIQ